MLKSFKRYFMLTLIKDSAKINIILVDINDKIIIFVLILNDILSEIILNNYFILIYYINMSENSRNNFFAKNERFSKFCRVFLFTK